MKNIVKLILVFTLLLGFSKTAKAGEYNCGSSKPYSMGGKFDINRYNCGSAGYAYCLAPKKYNATYYKTQSVVNPAKSNYELALTVAYTLLINNGAIDEADEDSVDGQDGGIISTTFRLISEYYGKLDHNGAMGASHINPYLLNGQTPKYYNTYWKGNTKALSALKIFQKAVKYVNDAEGKNAKEKYAYLQSKSILWQKDNAKFKATVTDDKRGTKDWDTVKFTVTLSASKNFKKLVDTLNWKSFTSSNSNKAKRNNSSKPICNCDNTKFSCDCVAKVKHSVNSFKLKGSITTSRNTINRMEIIIPKAGTASYQTFILVNSDPVTVSPNVTVTRKDITHEECTISGDNYYGKGGKEVDSIEDWREECVKQCRVEGTTYYCANSDPNKDGPVCDYATYRSQCDPISCSFETDPTTGARVYFNANGVKTTQEDYRTNCAKRCRKVGIDYYCQGDPNDLDLDGPECSFEEYYTQCEYCGIYETVCTNNPHDPNCPKDYFLNCPKCNPSVSVPSSCTDFDSDTTIKGTISDINKAETSCNPSVNAVKGCVIGGLDMAGNSFQIEALKNNPYCKAYCYEEYSFTLPTAKHSTSGGYFNLQMSVTGTRHCYLGSTNMIGRGEDKSIQQFDTSKFMKDLNDKRQAIDAEKGNLNDALREIDRQKAQKRQELEASLATINNNIDALMENCEQQERTLTENYDREISDYITKYGNNYNSSTLRSQYAPCNRGTGSKSCYKKGLNSISSNFETQLTNLRNDCDNKRQNFENQITDTENKLNNIDQDFLNDIKTANSTAIEKIVTLTTDMEKIINDFNQCTNVGTSWQNDMNFNPTITYQYNNYTTSPNKYDTGTFKRIDNNDSVIENKYCYNPTDGHYECENPVITSGNDVPSDHYTNLGSYYGCSYNVRNELSCGDRQIIVNMPNGIEKTVTNTATYVPGQSFNTYHQYGTVKTGDVCNGVGFNNCLWTRLPETALPVELKTGKGAFPFKIYVSNIGQYNSNNALGRLVGNDNSVLKNYTKEVGNKCSISDEPINGSYKQNFETLTAEIGYVCGYINNCDECDVTCSGDSCDLTCDEGCKMKCKTCIYDGDSNNFKYRTISLNNVFPNSCTTGTCTEEQRKEGYNWDKTASTKAKVTLEEIEATGDKVYETAEYSYTLTPSQMNEIRKYNKAVGTYANSTTPSGSPFNGQTALQCDQTAINGLTYSIRCLSTFLNDTTNTYFTTNKRETNFTLWTESGYCPSGNCLSREDGIGPSWK